MKKINKVFAALVLCVGLSLQVMSVRGDYETEQHIFQLTATTTFIGATALCLCFPLACAGTVGTAYVGYHLWEPINLVVNGISSYISNRQNENARLENIYQEESSRFNNKSEFVKSEFPEKIEERIDAIINQKYEKDGKSFEIFPTPKSKIFVLQNIQDFFDVQQSDEFKNFNLTLYEICTKKINELEQTLAKDRDENNRNRDVVRDNYRKQFGISASTLAKMSAVEINKKIDEVKEAINQMVRDWINKKYADGSIADAHYRALVSILAHLYYKQSDKKEMFTGEGLQQGWKQRPGVNIPQKKEMLEISGIDLAKRSAVMRTMGKNPKAPEYTQEAFEAKQEEYKRSAEENQTKPKPQVSWFWRMLGY